MSIFWQHNAQRNGEPRSGESGGRRPRIATACYASFGLEWVALWMLNGVDPKIYIKIWPIEMTRRRLFNIKYLPNRNVLEPGKIIIGEKVLMVFGK